MPSQPVLRPGIRRSVALLFLVCASSAIALYASEWILLAAEGRLRNIDLYPLLRAGDQLTYQRLAEARRLHQPFDERPLFEVIRGLRGEGREVVPPISPSVFFRFSEPMPVIDGARLLPLAGISGARTILCNESGRYAAYDADEHGFRNPRGLYDGPVDVALVGDSFVQGFCVPAEGELAAGVRSRYRTINLGISGAGPLTALAVLREYAGRLRPKVVVWCVFEGNDLADLDDELRDPVFSRYQDQRFEQGLWGKQPDIDRALQAVVDRWLRVHLADGPRPSGGAALAHIAVDAARLRSLRERLRSIRPGAPASSIAGERFSEAARLLKDETARWGGRLLIVYLPDIGRFSSRHRSEDSGRSIVSAAATSLQIPMVDIAPAFAASPDPLSYWPFRTGGHYTEPGYRLVADGILKGLTALGVSRGPEP